MCGCGGTAASEKDDTTPLPALLRAYSRREILIVKVCAAALAVVGLAAIIVSAVGGSNLQGSIDGILPMYDGIARWAHGVIDGAQEGIRDPSDGSYPDGFEPSEFDNVRQYLSDRLPFSVFVPMCRIALHGALLGAQHHVQRH